MTEFNTRTALNHRLRLDEAETRRRSCKALQSIAYRHRRAALRSIVRTVAVNAALIGSIVTAAVVMVACAIV